MCSFQGHRSGTGPLASLFGLMLLILPLLFLLIWHTLNFDIASSNLGLHLQEICAVRVPDHIHRALTSAMVCGTHVKGSLNAEVFRSSGLLHILVVSGAHLHFFAQFLGRLKFNHSLILLMVLVYCLFSGWQPPAVRSLVQIFLSVYFQRKLLHFAPWQTVWFSGIATALLFPDWLTGSSLLLSWICAFVLAISASKQMITSFILFGGLMPILMRWMPPHPLTVLINIAFAPVIGMIALPLCLSTLIFKNATSLADLFWTWTIEVLAPLQPFLNAVNPAESSNVFIWIGLAMSHIAWEAYYVSNQRERALDRALVARSLSADR